MPLSRKTSARPLHLDSIVSESAPADGALPLRFQAEVESATERKASRRAGGSGSGSSGANSADTSSSGANSSGQGTVRVVLPEPRRVPLEQRPAEALRLANEAFAQTGYWVSFYRAILGPNGIIPKMFPSRPERAYLHETPEFAEILKILTALRSSDSEKVEVVEPQRVLTIRMPQSVHAALVDEAEMLHSSVNKLCLSKFMAPIKSDYVPIEQGRPKGRKPRVSR